MHTEARFGRIKQYVEVRIEKYMYLASIAREKGICKRKKIHGTSPLSFGNTRTYIWSELDFGLATKQRSEIW